MTKDQLPPNSYWYFFYYKLLPTVAERMLSFAAIIPATILSFVFTAITSEEKMSSPGFATIIIIILILCGMIISTWWFLHYLERKTKLAVLIPIPFIRIPLKWLLYPFMMPFFGLRRLLFRRDNNF